jgi:hypothetical protein
VRATRGDRQLTRSRIGVVSDRNSRMIEEYACGGVPLHRHSARTFDRRSPFARPGAEDNPSYASLRQHTYSSNLGYVHQYTGVYDIPLRGTPSTLNFRLIEVKARTFSAVPNA